MKTLKILIPSCKENTIPQLKYNSFIIPVDRDLWQSVDEVNNEIFGELLIQYWAWKNVQSDYIGIASFDKSIEKYNEYELYSMIDNAQCMISGYEDLGESIKLYLDTQLSWQNKCIFEKIENIIEKQYPEMKNTFDKYLEDNYLLKDTYFIMEKDVFINYVEWLFGILSQIRKMENIFRLNESDIKIFQEDYIKILLAVYLRYHQIDTKVFSMDTRKLKSIKELQPAFKDNNIPIVLMSSNLYAPILGVCIKSICNQINERYNYDIIVFEKEISELNKDLIREIVKSYNNVKVRFFNPQKILRNVKLFVSATNFAYEAYYRVFSPWILRSYDKAIVMDCDIIVNDDIVRLYNCDIEHYLGSAMKDPAYLGMLNEEKKIWYDYSKSVLEMEDPYNYFNSGVLVLNFKAMRKTYDFDYILELAGKVKFRFQEQDLMNKLLESRVNFLDHKWNSLTENNLNYGCAYYPQKAPKKEYMEYKKAKRNPSIIHYYATPKPWDVPENPLAYIFWRTARETPFYEILIARLSYGCAYSIFQGNKISRKTKIKNFIKIFLPKGTKRHRLAKKLYFKVRGIPYVE